MHSTTQLNHTVDTEVMFDAFLISTKHCDHVYPEESLPGTVEYRTGFISILGMTVKRGFPPLPMEPRVGYISPVITYSLREVHKR
jgi:hypothetical protein